MYFTQRETKWRIGYADFGMSFQIGRFFIKLPKFLWRA